MKEKSPIKVKNDGIEIRIKKKVKSTKIMNREENTKESPLVIKGENLEWGSIGDEEVEKEDGAGDKKFKYKKFKKQSKMIKKLEKTKDLDACKE